MIRGISDLVERVWGGDDSGGLLNDVQSQLNPTRVALIRRPRSIEDIQQALDEARRGNLSVSVAGGRHAQGGQQFGTDTLHLDTSGFNQPLALDTDRGLVRMQGGTQWPELIEYLHDAQKGSARQWSIRQKQTGVDQVTIAGTLSANAHGRGLAFPSFIGDVESFVLIGADGQARTCSRDQNPELFGLVIGGYGNFGVVAEVELRLVPRRKVERVVKIIEIKDLMPWVQKRLDEGFVYGDCQHRSIRTRTACRTRRCSPATGPWTTAVRLRGGRRN